MTPPNSREDKTASETLEQTTTHDEKVHVDKTLSNEAAAAGQGVSGYETLTIWETARKFKYNTFICSLMAVAAAADGYQIGMIGNIIANTGFVKQFGTKVNAAGEPYLESPVLSGWNGAASVGQFTGMVTLPFLSARFGRKFSMYWLWILLATSIAVECAAKDWKAWLFAKFFGGWGVGCLQSTIPTYIAEVAPVRIRGALLMGYSMWFITGQFFAPVALQVLSQSDPNDYKTAIYSQWSQIGLMIIIFAIVPESPAWCVSRGKEEQAKKMLKRLHWEVKDYDVDYQYQLLVLNDEHERAVAAEQSREKWYAIFKGQDGFRTIISLWTLMAQQLIGLGIFFAYATYFFQQAGLKDPFKITCITSSINIAFSIVVMYLADSVGRRLLACSGTTLCWACCVVVGILGVVPKTSATNNLLVVFTCFWNIGLVANGATGWGFIGEISSQRLRPYTAGFAAASTVVVGTALGVLIPYMINVNEWNWGLKTSWFFAGLGAPMTFAMWYLIPETKGRSAAELDELFERKIKPYRFHKTKTVTQRMVGHEDEA